MTPSRALSAISISLSFNFAPLSAPMRSLPSTSSLRRVARGRAAAPAAAAALGGAATGAAFQGGLIELQIDITERGSIAGVVELHAPAQRLQDLGIGGDRRDRELLERAAYVAAGDVERAVVACGAEKIMALHVAGGVEPEHGERERRHRQATVLEIGLDVGGEAHRKLFAGQGIAAQREVELEPAQFVLLPGEIEQRRAG